MTHKIRVVDMENVHIMSTNFAKTLVWKHVNDVKLWRHKQRTQNTNGHLWPWTKPPQWKFSAYATASHHAIHRLVGLHFLIWCQRYPALVHEPLTARKRCQIRGPLRRNKTRFTCRKCGAPVCKEHLRIFCSHRWKESGACTLFFVV